MLHRQVAEKKIKLSERRINGANGCALIGNKIYIHRGRERERERAKFTKETSELKVYYNEKGQNESEEEQK